MKLSKNKTFITIFLIISITLDYIILKILGKDISLFWNWITTLSYVVSIETILIIIFEKYLWKLKFLRWIIVPFPDLTGEWVGTITSTWTDHSSGDLLPDFECKLKIDHQFNDISIELITKQSQSFSFSEEIIYNKKNRSISISYLYSNQPDFSVEEKSRRHTGTMLLYLIEESTKMVLKGNYYTDRKTTGTLCVSMDFKNRNKNN